MYSNARELFTIHCKTTTMNSTTYRNANRFVHSYCVRGEDALKAKIEELKNIPDLKVEEVFNGVGEKIKF
jgi:hypothetical protein